MFVGVKHKGGGAKNTTLSEQLMCIDLKNRKQIPLCQNKH
jgi:hypothetical protein